MIYALLARLIGTRKRGFLRAHTLFMALSVCENGEYIEGRLNHVVCSGCFQHFFFFCFFYSFLSIFV